MAIESGISDRQPWGAARAGIDWDAVYAEQLPRVYNFFRYRTGNDATAEDLTSRTFEKAWAARKRCRRDVAGLSTWLFSIARVVRLPALRDRQRRRCIVVADRLFQCGPDRSSAVSAARRHRDDVVHDRGGSQTHYRYERHGCVRPSGRELRRRR